MYAAPPVATQGDEAALEYLYDSEVETRVAEVKKMYDQDIQEYIALKDAGVDGATAKTLVGLRVSSSLLTLISLMRMRRRTYEKRFLHKILRIGLILRMRRLRSRLRLLYLLVRIRTRLRRLSLTSRSSLRVLSTLRSRL